MNALLRQAEEILDTAVRAGRNAAGLAIVIDRQGGMRILDADGWTLAGLTAEFGASAVFKVTRGQGMTTVEGRAGCDRCLVERHTGAVPVPWAPLAPVVCHPMRLQAAPLWMAASHARDSAV